MVLFGENGFGTRKNRRKVPSVRICDRDVIKLARGGSTDLRSWPGEYRRCTVTRESDLTTAGVLRERPTERTGGYGGRALPVKSTGGFTDETLPSELPIGWSPRENFTVELDTDEHFCATAVRRGRTVLSVPGTGESTGPPPVTGRASERKVPGQF